MPYDKLGYPISIGDTIVFPSRSRYSEPLLTRGEVTQIQDIHVKVSKARNFRLANSVINISYMQPLEEVKQKYPELFI